MTKTTTKEGMTDIDLAVYDVWIDNMLKTGERPPHREIVTMVDALLDEARRLKKNDAWISVEDRLPGEDENVLITNGHAVVVSWRTGNGWLSHVGRPSVTHWMPLPEPPKQG